MGCKPQSTHHMACDCREAKMRRMEETIKKVLECPVPKGFCKCKAELKTALSDPSGEK